MGLDVYLYHCVDRNLAKSKETEAERLVEQLWDANPNKTYGEYTEDEKNEISIKTKNIYESLGLDEHGEHKSVTSVSENSKLYPEHYFKIGYFRSSYNSGGINTILRNRGLPDMYALMNADHNEYEISHDWKMCLSNINSAIEAYENMLNGVMGKYDVVEVSRPFLDKTCNTAQEALKLFENEITKKPHFTSYGNGVGDFFLDGIKVVGVIPSQNTFVQAFLIVEKEKNNSDDEWYLQALKVMRETCEYVLAKPDPENYYMHWSG